MISYNAIKGLLLSLASSRWLQLFIFSATHEIHLSLKIIQIINQSTVFLGVYAAAYDLGIEWVVIEGVSGLAGDHKSASDHWRSFSSLMAASLVAHFLSDVDVFEDWRHYGDK